MHHIPISSCLRLRLGVVLYSTTVVACLLATACSVPPPRVEVEAALTEAVPAAGAIEFRTERGPLDEPADDPAVLTLDEALRRAMQTDPGLQQALARVRSAWAEAREAGMPPDPVLSVVLRETEGGGPLQVDAGLTTAIVKLLRTPRLASAAHNRLRAEASRTLITGLDVVEDVQTHYAAIQSLESLRAILQERQEIVQRLLDVATRRLDVGEGTRSEVVAFEAERLAIEIEAAERLNELRQERLALARRIGEPSSEATWEVEPFAPPPTDLGSESLWIDAALKRRPEIQAAEWDVLALGDDLSLASGSPFDDASLGLEAEKDGDWSVGPGISTPIPLFGRSQARVDAALARQVESRHRLTEAQRTTVEEVRSALAVLQLSVANLKRLRSELIPLQERRRTDVQRAYEAQELDVNAVLLVDQSLQEARTHLLDLERQAAAATYRLQRAVGGPAAYESIRDTKEVSDAQ